MDLEPIYFTPCQGTVRKFRSMTLYDYTCVYSRLSLFRLSEVHVRPPRYTGHLAWHGMLAIILCLLHKTHPEVRPLAIPFTGQCWLPQQGFQCNFIRILRPDMTFWVWFSK